MFTVYFGYLEFVVLICIQKESIVGSCVVVSARVEGSVPIIFLLSFHCPVNFWDRERRSLLYHFVLLPERGKESN